MTLSRKAKRVIVVVMVGLIAGVSGAAYSGWGPGRVGAVCTSDADCQPGLQCRHSDIYSIGGRKSCSYP